MDKFFRQVLRTFSAILMSVSLILVLFPLSTFAQKTILRGELDEMLTIKNVTLSPVVDNVGGIYSKPLTIQLQAIVEEDRQWSLNTFPESIKFTPEEFEDHPDYVQSALKKVNADALISTRIIKGSQGISIKMNLFLGRDGLLFAKSELLNHPAFEISDLRQKIRDLFLDLKSKVPFSGKILSRKGNQVTIDVGSLQGLKEGQDIDVVHIVKLNRHPKYNFIVSVEKEIIGKLKTTKIESSLSFADVVLERYEGVLQPNMKVEKVEFVEHPSIGGPDSPPDLSNRKDKFVLGENPQEWIPTPNPRIGKVALLLGLSNYAVSNTIDGSGAVNSSQFPTPNIGVDSEIWMTSEWFANFRLQQHIVSLSNSLGGSGPGTINMSSSQMGLYFGYNILPTEHYFSPKFQVLGGYSQLASQADTSSPMAYTSVSMSGFGLGVSGSLPIDEKVPMNVGAKFMYFLTGSISETPVTSGSSASVKISQFSAFGDYKWTERMNWRGQLDYDLYSANFTGTGTRSPGASSLSHTLINFLLGVQYLF